MKTIGFVFNTVDRRCAISPFCLASLALIAALAMLLPSMGCKPKDTSIQHGEGQIASAQEKEQQNRSLIAQVVQAAEAQEKHPDPTYLRGALGRLNPWLAERASSVDFVLDPEYEELSNEFATLVETAKKADSLVKLFADENQKVEEQNCDELLETLQTLKSQINPLAEKCLSNTLATFELMVDDILEKLDAAKEIQFADPTEIYQTQIQQVIKAPSYQYYNFETLSAGLDDYTRLLKTDGQVFLPQDVDYLRSVIWFRDVFTWAKGTKQDDLTVIKELFDWTVKNVVLAANELPSPMGPVSQLEWQTLLLGEGSPMDRAIVFIELLRQHRLDAFVLRPDGEVPSDFPVIVAVRLDGEAYLFDMMRGLPFPSAAPDALILDDEAGLVINKVATLNEVAQNDSILRKFDLPDFPYKASAQDFESVVAYVPSTPFQVALRMIPLEQEFSGAVNTILSTPFDLQQDRISDLERIAAVKRLQEANVPILEQAIFPEEADLVTQVFMTPLESRGSLEVDADSTHDSSSDAMEDYTGNSARSFAGNVSGRKQTELTPLWLGKILYLRGQFVDDTGAAHWLLQGRISERILRNQEADIPKNVAEYLKEYNEWAASQNLTPSEDELRQIAQQTALQFQLEIATMRYIKVLTSYNLTLLSEASGSDSAAMERLNDESLRFRRQPDDAFQLGDEFRNAANYLRARLLEKQGSWTSAVARLRACIDRGSHVRANWIAELAGIEEEAPRAEQPSEDVPDAQSDE